MNNIGELKNLVPIGFADSAGVGISAIFWFYLASIVEVEQFGELHYLLGIAGLGFTVSVLGTQNSIIVYMAKKVKIGSTLFFISILGGIITGFIIFAMLLRFDVSFLLIGYTINELGIGYLLGKKSFIKYSKFVLIQKVLTFTLGIGFFHIFGIEGIIFALALSYSHFIIIIIKEFKNSKINFSLVKSRSNFLISNYFYNLSGGLKGNIDKLIIVPLLGFGVLGNYAISLQFYGVLIIFSSIAFKYLLPEDSSGNSNVKLKMGVIFLSLGIAISSSFILPEVIPKLFPKYISAIDAIRIISLAVFPATITMIYTSKFLAIEKSRYVLCSSLIGVITQVIGVVILGPFFGIIGIAISFLISSVTSSMFLVTINKFSR
jgi:O-antigen/teichoic acid export membrane protein